MPRSKLSFGAPSLPIPTSFVATPLMEPSAWYKVSTTAWPGQSSTPSASACSASQDTKWPSLTMCKEGFAEVSRKWSKMVKKWPETTSFTPKIA